jgi:membrane-associated protease RseP (regulator of RpoE activity)
MDQFVCVRIVQCWGLDLTIFQFDWHRTFAVFFMNADKAVYGRYEERTPSNLDSLRKALEGALELHKGYPANKAELAGKAGTPIPWKVPEEMPSVKAKGKYREADSKGGCIHCHDVSSNLSKSYKQVGQKEPERFALSYPVPQRIGVMLDPRERALVTDVSKGWPADLAGVQVGDRIVKFGGQPILSATDVEWVIFTAPDSGKLAIELDRGGRKVESTLELAPGWRKR